MSRRRLFEVVLGAYGLIRRARALAVSTELKLPDDIPLERFDFESKVIEGWMAVDDQWAVERVGW